MTPSIPASAQQDFLVVARIQRPAHWLRTAGAAARPHKPSRRWDGRYERPSCGRTSGIRRSAGAAPVSAPVRGGFELNHLTQRLDFPLRLHLLMVAPPFVQPGCAALPQPERSQPDETLGVALIVAARFLETRDRRIVERVRRLAPRDPHAALEELQPRDARITFFCVSSISACSDSRSGANQCPL